MVPVPPTRVEIRALWDLVAQGTKVFLDGYREVGGDKYYDSDGNELQTDHLFSDSATTINTRVSALYAIWDKLGDCYTERGYMRNDDLMCACVH